MAKPAKAAKTEKKVEAKPVEPPQQDLLDLGGGSSSAPAGNTTGSSGTQSSAFNFMSSGAS